MDLHSFGYKVIYYNKRCFGKFLEYVTMVPIVEMFNHECSDVYYDFDYLEDNINKPAVYIFNKSLLKD
jgi:hypothetical protein